MCAHRAGRRSQNRLLFPKANPPGLNHSILTGTLLDAPRLGRNPIGEPVTLVTVEFPVADSAHPQTLLTWASCEIEVSAAQVERHGIRELEGGTPILAAGQLSERWVSSGGRSSKRSAIVAMQIHPGPPDHDELLIPGGRPDGS